MVSTGHVKDHWTYVDVPPRFLEVENWKDRREARDWLDAFESTGKYFAGHERYWFEFPEDAAMYLLRWS